MLGYPTNDETGLGGSNGRYNYFANDGIIMWTTATGAWSVHGAVLNHYQALGGPYGFLGFPTSNETSTGDATGRYNTFQGGNAYWSPSSGARSIHGAILGDYLANGGPTGVLGYPTTDETGLAGTNGRYNYFSNDGIIMWSPATGSAYVTGPILNHYQALGGPYGFLGFPTSNQIETPDKTGAANYFQGGMVYSSVAGAWSIHGAILGTWQSIGWESSPLGYPTGDEYAIAGGTEENFQHGYITWSAVTDITHVFG
ncbi:MAG: LGFP repeat-containing protein [Acidimicrobiales bacterium]